MSYRWLVHKLTDVDKYQDRDLLFSHIRSSPEQSHGNPSQANTEEYNASHLREVVSPTKSPMLFQTDTSTNTKSPGIHEAIYSTLFNKLGFQMTNNGYIQPR